MIFLGILISILIIVSTYIIWGKLIDIKTDILTEFIQFKTFQLSISKNLEYIYKTSDENVKLFHKDLYKIDSDLQALQSDLNKLSRDLEPSKTPIPPIKTNNWDSVREAFKGPVRVEVNERN